MRITVLFMLLNWSAIFGQGEPSFVLHLFGNSVEAKGENNLAQLLSQIDNKNDNTGILFLGDDIPQLIKNDTADHTIDNGPARGPRNMYDQLKPYDGKLYFIPGAHKSIIEQERIIEQSFEGRDVFIPDDGCPGPEVKNLSKGIKLITLNSQWWLEREDSNPKDCRNNNKYQVIQELRELLDKNDEKIIVLALHHPIYTEGKHGGFVPFAQQVFPIPVLGSMRPFLRRLFGTSQDLWHYKYSAFRNELLSVIKDFKNVILCSAHENNLQYFKKGQNHFVVSGSATHNAPLATHGDALYSSSKKGFASLYFMKDGSVQLNFKTITDDHHNVLDFSKEIIERLPAVPDFADKYHLEKLQTTINADNQYKKGSVHKMIFGKVYRQDWQTPIAIQNLNLSEEYDGLHPLKRGGGMVSKTLHLEDKAGKRYVLRSLKKEVWRSIPEIYRNSLVQKVFQDQISNSQPYAALAVPPLAEAAGVYHTNPRIIYLPEQRSLGDFNRSFANDVYLFEVRPTGDHKDEEPIADSKSIISFSKMIDRIQNSPNHRLHQDQVLRSRLFDIYLGDWDRHDDQWRWASFKVKNKNDKKVTYYEPVPRDRDQVFYRVGGLGPWLVKLIAPETRKLQSFNPKIKNVKYLGFQSRHFDRSFLNEMTKTDWIDMAEELKHLITDAAIDESINRLPHEVREENRTLYKTSLVARRNDLPKYAADFYDHLAIYVDVVGTDKKELFEIERKEDNTVQILEFSLDKDGQKGELLYERLLRSDETKELRVYGLGGADQFVLSGKQKKGPLIRIIGGPGRDIIMDKADRSGFRKGTRVYDSLEGNDFTLGADIKDLRSDNYLDNQYDREEYSYDSRSGLVFFGFNPNDGFNISTRLSVSKYGFRKLPFKSKHSVHLGASFGNSRLNLGYELQLTDIIGKADFNLLTEANLPSNVNHFFGLTNEFTFSIDDFADIEDLDFFKYGQRRVFIKPALQFTSKNTLHDLKIGPYFEYTRLNDNVDKFIGDPSLSKIDLINFSAKNYVGLDFDYRITNLDNSINPTLGMTLRLNASYNVNASYSEETFVGIKGALTLYNLIWLPKPFVLATKVSGGINYGDFSFYQANYAGFDEGLRAFRQNRFGGKSSLVISNDLRVKLFNISGDTLPFSFGLVGSYDVGRAWNKDVSSSTWHNSYGGGVWFNFLDVLPLSFYFMTSDEKESSFIVKTGFAL